jgi:CheY-like chemotaxis protein
MSFGRAITASGNARPQTLWERRQRSCRRTRNPKPETGNPKPSLSTTILFIDHQDDNRQYWVQRLRTSSPDCLVLEASNGAAGLAICESPQVDCVISELTLPDMSGFQVLLKLVAKPRQPEIAFIFLTRLTLAPMRHLALNNGAQAYLVKSHTSGDELGMTIHKALATVAPNQKEPRF